MSKLSFEEFIVNVGLAEAEKMNTCHDNLGQFCSTGGGSNAGTGKITPPAHLGQFEKRIYTELGTGKISRMVAENQLTQIGYSPQKAKEEISKWEIGGGGSNTGAGKITPPAHLGQFEKRTYSQLGAGEISRMVAENQLVQIGYSPQKAKEEISKWKIGR